MKRIVIDLYDDNDGHLHGLTEIKSEELVINYISAYHMHGLQSAYPGDDDRHQKQMDICDKINKLCLELSEISK